MLPARSYYGFLLLPPLWNSISGISPFFIPLVCKAQTYSKQGKHVSINGVQEIEQKTGYLSGSSQIVLGTPSFLFIQLLFFISEPKHRSC